MNTRRKNPISAFQLGIWRNRIFRNKFNLKKLKKILDWDRLKNRSILAKIDEFYFFSMKFSLILKIFCRNFTDNRRKLQIFYRF